MFGGKYKDLWWGAIPDLPFFQMEISRRHLTAGQNTSRKKHVRRPIEEIRSRLVRHLQSMGGHGPNMGPAIFMAV